MFLLNCKLIMIFRILQVQSPDFGFPIYAQVSVSSLQKKGLSPIMTEYREQYDSKFSSKFSQTFAISACL